MPIRNVIGMKYAICHHTDLVNLYDCEIGSGTKIGAFVEIGAGVFVGKQCKIQSHAFIPPGIIIGDGVFIGPGVIFCNTKHPMTGEKYLATFVQDNVVIGAGCTILPGLILGKNSVIGAGSVVTKNVPAGETWYGNPAKQSLW